MSKIISPQLLSQQQVNTGQTGLRKRITRSFAVICLLTITLALILNTPAKTFSQSVADWFQSTFSSQTEITNVADSSNPKNSALN